MGRAISPDRIKLQKFLDQKKNQKKFSKTELAKKFKLPFNTVKMHLNNLHYNHLITDKPGKRGRRASPDTLKKQKRVIDYLKKKPNQSKYTVNDLALELKLSYGDISGALNKNPNFRKHIIKSTKTKGKQPSPEKAIRAKKIKKILDKTPNLTTQQLAEVSDIGYHQVRAALGDLPEKYQGMIVSARKTSEKRPMGQVFKLSKGEVVIHKGRKKVEIIEGNPFMRDVITKHGKKSLERDTIFWEEKGYQVIIIPSEKYDADLEKIVPVHELWLSLKPVKKIKNPPRFVDEAIMRREARLKKSPKKRKMMKQKTIKKVTKKATVKKRTVKRKGIGSKKRKKKR